MPRPAAWLKTKPRTGFTSRMTRPVRHRLPPVPVDGSVRRETRFKNGLRNEKPRFYRGQSGPRWGHVTLVVTRPAQRLCRPSLYRSRNSRFNQAVRRQPPFCSRWESSSPGAALSLWERSGCPLSFSLFLYPSLSCPREAASGLFYLSVNSGAESPVSVLFQRPHTPPASPDSCSQSG